MFNGNQIVLKKLGAGDNTITIMFVLVSVLLIGFLWVY
jgi:predicted membrane-bound mannosyltransferase